MEWSASLDEWVFSQTVRVYADDCVRLSHYQCYSILEDSP